MTTQYTPQQLAVIDAAGRPGNQLIDAKAGTGKTTTLIGVCSRLSGYTAFCAYNKKIADEIGAKVRTAGLSNVKAGTFHSFGFQNWRRVAPHVKVDAFKVANIMQAMQIDEELQPFVSAAVSLAKQRAIGVLCPTTDHSAWQYLVDHFDLEDKLTSEGKDTLCMEDVVANGLALAKQVLQRSIEQDRDVIDFDDMIYAPLVHKVKVWQNDNVLIDEAQDTNPARRALAKAMLKPGGKLIAVGDPNQAIYGFTGADNDAMDLIKQEFNCTVMPLTVSFRCPTSVIELAQTWVPTIEAAPNAKAGTVTVMADVAFRKLEAHMVDAESAMLCRNTKPLVEEAYALIRRGIGCHVEGKDIGKGLLNLVNKWKARSLDALRTKLETHLEKEVAKFMAKGQEQKAESLTDRIETLFVIMDQCVGGDVNTLREQINKLFGDVEAGNPSPNFTLSTVHKSKGREWKRVYLLGRAKYMPSKFARQDWQFAQERNLMYVAVTRSLDTLVEVVVTA